MRFNRFVIPSVILTAATIVANCGDSTVGPTASSGTDPQVAAGNSGPGGGLQACSPLRAATTTMTVGRNGGTIKVGPHELRIPSGALTQNVRITASIKPELINRIHFEPDGLTFQEAAELRMDFDNCRSAPKGIVYVSPTLQILEYLPIAVDWHGSEARTRIKHFSDYALSDEAFSDHVIAWGPGTVAR